MSVKRAELQFQTSLAWANWWVHAASNGHAAMREVVRGDGHKMTPDELRDQAMNTAKNHIHRAQECADYIAEEVNK